MNNIKVAIIPVAGKGTRFLPVTKCVNKIMFPIINKPAIHYLVEECINAGIEEIVFVINSLQKDVREYFNLNSEYYKNLTKSPAELEELTALINKINISYVIQDEPRGLGDAVLECEKLVNKSSFALLLGDEIVLNNNSSYGLGDLINYYNNPKINDNNISIIGVKKVKEEETNKYGIVKLENKETNIKFEKIIDMVEKPNSNPPSLYAACGRYILSYDIFNYLKENSKKVKDNEELGITESIKNLCLKDNVYACDFAGEKFDIGNHAGYVEANIAFSLNDDSIKGEIKKFIGEVNNEEDN